jgi:hypothetical protein
MSAATSPNYIGNVPPLWLGGVGLDIFRRSFVNADLVAGVLTVTHNLGVRYHAVAVYDDTNQLVTPDAVTDVDANSLTIDLTSFGVITGTWNVVVV